MKNNIFPDNGRKDGRILIMHQVTNEGTGVKAKRKSSIRGGREKYLADAATELTWIQYNTLSPVPLP